MGLCLMTNSTIHLEHVFVEFPIYDADRSFRSLLFKGRVGGHIGRSASHPNRTVITSLRDISLDIMRGDRVGLLGPNGAGKSTLLKVMAGTYAPSSGSVSIHGKISTILTLGMGFDDEESGYENCFIAGYYLGLSRKEIMQRIPEIEQFCELGDYMKLPVRTYSTGMLVRLSFAIATSVDPDILLIDEIIGAGDAAFTTRAHARIERLLASANSLVLASHATEILKTFCTKGLFLLSGQIAYFGDINAAIEEYQAWIAASN